MMNIIDAAYAQLAQGNATEAVELLANASIENGDAAAELAFWYLAGDKIARDLPIARHFLAVAAENGHANCAHLEIALTANGTGAPPDWQKAVQLLVRLSKTDSAARQQLSLLSPERLDHSGFPIKVPERTYVNESPQIYTIRHFCSPEECEHIVQITRPGLQPATVFEPETGRRVVHPVRSCDDATVGPLHETLVVQAINRRIAAVTSTQVTQGEPLTILRYGLNQQYRPHLDILPKTINQRYKTAILYLNDGYAGGETHFPLLDVTIIPRAGDLLVFDCLDESLKSQPLSQHAGLPVLNGTKWIATRWIRAGTYNPWTDYGK